jgi:oligoendopeptidase F
MKHFTFSSKTILLIIFTVLTCSAGFAQQSREEIAEKYKWNFSDMYESDAAWREALESFKQKINEIDQYKGTLTESPENLLEALQFNSELSKQASKIYTYVSMKSDIDTRKMKYNGMKQEVQQIFSEFGARSAFFQPEILTANWKKLKVLSRKNPSWRFTGWG